MTKHRLTPRRDRYRRLPQYPLRRWVEVDGILEDAAAESALEEWMAAGGQTSESTFQS